MNLVTIHLITLLCTVVVILFADHEGFSYMRGKKQTLSHKLTQFFHYGVWVGLCLMITTGVFLALPAWEFYLKDPVFLLKMFFVLVLVVNGVFIGKFTALASEKPFAELPSRMQHTLRVSGALSTIGWVGAAVIGYFFL